MSFSLVLVGKTCDESRIHHLSTLFRKDFIVMNLLSSQRNQSRAYRIVPHFPGVPFGNGKEDADLERGRRFPIVSAGLGNRHLPLHPATLRRVPSGRQLHQIVELIPVTARLLAGKERDYRKTIREARWREDHKNLLNGDKKMGASTLFPSTDCINEVRTATARERCDRGQFFLRKHHSSAPCSLQAFT